MKTAEDIMFEIRDYGFSPEYCIRLIKEYATLVSNETLETASYNVWIKSDNIKLRELVKNTATYTP